MAIQLNYTTKQGVTVTNAYIKIASFTGDKNSVSLRLAVYPNAAASVFVPSEGGFPQEPITNEFVSLILANGSTLNQMYTALKALPGYTDAVDA